MASSVSDQLKPPTAAGLPYVPLATFRPTTLQDDSQAADCQGKRIGILIVTYNAISTLVPVLKRITPNVWRNVEEVVILDDASDDATYEVAVGLKVLRDLPKLTVLKHSKNLGYGGNQKAGYRYFIDRGFDAVVLLHGDGQYAPEILAHMYEKVVRGEADAVFGSRMMRTYGGALKGGMPLYKFVGNKILTFFENRALGLQLTEFHSGYRAYNLHALEHIDLSKMTNDFHFDTEIIIKLHHQGFRIREVPIPTYYGTEICYVDGLKYASNVIRAVRRYKRTCRSIERAPEFAEYFVQYPVKVMQYSSHDHALRLVGANQNVLDVGCGHGYLAEKLAANGNRVVGIDSVPHPSRRAVFDEYVCADLNKGIGPALDTLAERKVDCVLLLDVLEHLVEPERVLRQAAGALKPHGRLIVSLPNVANLTVRFSLLFGRFEYRERGILDRTHVRFFTWKTARALLEQCGWRVIEMRPTVMPIELVLGLMPSNPVMRALNHALAAMTRLFPRFLGYQVVLVARPSDPVDART